MGFLKQMKDMKNMVAEAPELLAQSTALAANAQAMAAAQQTAAVGAVASATADESAIAGVTLEQYVSISRALADAGYDDAQSHAIAAAHGVSATSWDAAVSGWNLRMQTQPAVAQRFNALYTGH